VYDDDDDDYAYSIRTSNDKRGGGDHLGKARLYSDTAHRASVEVRLWVVSDVRQSRHTTVVHGRTTAGERRGLQPTSRWWRRQRHRRRREIKRVRLVCSKQQLLTLGLNRIDNYNARPTDDNRLLKTAMKSDLRKDHSDVQ